MVLKNITRNTIITNDLQEATTTSDKLLGLLKKTNSRSLLFITRFGIHTFFLKKPIDVLVLDNKLNVVNAQTISQNQIFLYNPKHNTIIELPSGTIKKSKTIEGDRLTLQK